MAAAWGLVVGETQLASPELALVDPALAAELRLSLRPVEGTEQRARASFEEAPTASDENAPVQRDVADELEEGEAEAGEAASPRDDEYIVSVTEETPAHGQRTSSHYPVLPEPTLKEDAQVEQYFADEAAGAGAGDAEHFHDFDCDVDVVEPTPAEDQHTSSHYPVLPAPKLEEEAVDETDVALARIRERLTDDLPAPKRTLRRRFTLASGASAVCAFGVLILDVQLQVAQLPDWFLF